MNKLLKRVIKIIDDSKGESISVFDVSKKSTISDYVIICNGNNKKHTGAIIEHIEKDLKDNKIIRSKSSNKESDWKLIDIGNIIIHVFNKDSRIEYDLDTMYNESIKIDINI